MKRNLLSAFVFLFLGVSAFSQEKIFETKITAEPYLGYNANSNLAVFAGGKSLNVLQLTDGKMILDKSYKDGGVAISKVADAYVNDNLDKAVICDKAAVYCLDVKSGSKVWENKSFTELDNGSGALMIDGDYVLVSDKKGKDNYSLTCLSLNDGKELWTLSNEKVKINPGSLYYLSGYNTLGIFSAMKSGVNIMRLVDLKSGKVDASVELEGSPIFTFSDKNAGVIFIHHRVSEETSYLSAVSMKDHKSLWKVKSGNKSPQYPMTMNTDVYEYYAKVKTYDDKVLLITEGIEAYDAASGKLLFNIPFVPYYKWGVGHYTNGIFEPIVTDNGILLADRTSGKLFIRMMDKNTGKQVWSTDALKDMDCAPNAVVAGGKAVIQFGGLNYFEVINNTGIGKLLKPFTVTGFDLSTGKTAWNIESKKDFYYISPSNDKVMIVGTKDFQTIDPANGSVVSTEKNPFKEDYFMTKFTAASMHKIQKNAEFDFSKRQLLLFEDGKLSLNSF